MSLYERFQLRGAMLILAGYVFFVVMMMDGLMLGSHTAGRMAFLVIGTMAMLAVGFAGLWVLAMRSDGPHRHGTPDERERQIELVAERAGYRLLDGAIFVLIILALVDAGGAGILGSFNMNRPEGLIFALVTASALAGVVRFVAGWHAARQV